jgi:murein DD-endopeptidase MepM/ murein hydrolase activator NlpD
VTGRSRLLVNLAAVALLAVVTVGWVLTQVVGSGALAAPFVVTADFSSSGGVFTNQEVTYRGVLVGTVEELSLNEAGGIRELGAFARFERVNQRELIDKTLRYVPGFLHAVEDASIPWRSPDGREFYRLRLGLVYDNVRSSWPCKYRLPEEWERFPHERGERAPKTTSRCRRRGAEQQAAQSLVAALEQWASEHPSTIVDTTPAAPPRPAGEADVQFIWPLVGEITSFFGNDNGRTHTGLDINGTTGHPFVAAAAGRVELAEPYFGYGNTIIIDHGNGLATLYGHLSDQFVKVGDAVEQGDVIGLVGCTGSCTGDHLHFEVRVNDEPVDPLPNLRRSR